jgi:hypothetical protein
MHIVAFGIIMYSPEGHTPSEGYYVSAMADISWIVPTLLPCLTTVIITGLSG